MTLEQLRLKHPRFIYKRFDVTSTRETVTFTYEFILEPDISFHPTVTIPFSGTIDTAVLRAYAFTIGLVESISYWKAACPRECVIEAGSLSEEQVRFWYDLFLHGLGEFFYRNEIDFTTEGFLEIKSKEPSEPVKIIEEEQKHGDLVLVGGGKDSAVTLGILKNSDRMLQTMILNPTKAAYNNLTAAGISDPIVVSRTIDPTLLKLNAQGYLNGHTPFSAYLAFLGVTVATLYKKEYVIVSNEKSANEGNVMFHGMEINHQYSKSYRFESLVRTYIASTFQHAPEYLSFLRVLNDVQISKLFSGFPKYYQTFRSCNTGSATNSWCGACPKCAFTYLTLFPYIKFDDMMRIFGREYFRDPAIINHIYALCGLRAIKPFDCVGTQDEAKFSVMRSIESYSQAKREVPDGLLMIKSDAHLSEGDMARLQHEVLDGWNDAHAIPDSLLILLRDAWNRAHTL